MMSRVKKHIPIIGTILVAVLILFHYRLYYLFDTGIGFGFEILIYLVLFIVYCLFNWDSWDGDILICLFIYSVIAFFSSFFSIYVIERKVFYATTAKKHGMVYTSVVKSTYPFWGNPRCTVCLFNDVRTRKEQIGLSRKWNVRRKDTIIVSFPELPKENESFYYNIYSTKCYEPHPNELQIEYCTNGVKLSNKIHSLKDTPTKDELMEFLLRKKNHTAKVISAVVVKNSKKYVYFDAPQSDELLFAHKRVEKTAYRERQRVLIAYDVDKPQAFYVCNPSPSNEEYERYNTQTGLPLTQEYYIEALGNNGKTSE